MLEDMSKDALFYNYYAQWIEVYKKDAIREATMAKYRMTQKWVEKLAPELKVCELTRTAYQKISHKRLIDIITPTQKTVDALSRLEIGRAHV